MDQRASKRELMSRYLLGECTEEERLRLEADYFADDACYRKLLEAEDELVQQWVHGELSPAQCQTFSRRLRTSAAGREKEAFARGLTDVASRLQSSATDRVPRRNRWMLGWPIPVAAALALAVAGWELLQVRQLRLQVSSLTASHAQLNRPVPAPAAISFALTPGLSRGLEPLQRLQIPASASTVRFQLLLPKQAAFSLYRVTLLTGGGREVWSQAGSWPTGVSLDLEAPASVLAADEYNWILQGQAAGRKFQEVAAYHFAAERGQ